MADIRWTSIGHAGVRSPPAPLGLLCGLPCALAAALFLVVAVASTPATAQRLTAAAAAQQVSETYGVEALRVREMRLEDGSLAYAVTVMAPGGDTNDAFQVTTLLIDARTGELIPQYRQTPTGQAISGAPSNVPRTEVDGPALRRLSNRP